MGKIALAAFAALLVTSSLAAAAAPLSNTPPALITADNWYFWLDGAYENVRLPSSALGIHNTTAIGGPTSNSDRGPSQSFKPTSTGDGVRGALGYRIPGSDFRFELGGSYVAAKAADTQTTTSSPGAALVLIGGRQIVGYNCALFTCVATGAFKSNYTAWQLDGKVAAERRFGAITVTPSLALLGGTSSDHQNFSQAFSQVPINTASYSATVALHWTDFGARAGLDLSAPISNALTLQLGGWIGGASRQVSLSGSDSAAISAPPPNLFGSSVSARSNRGVWLANAEAGFTYALSPALSLRGFAGLNYDDAVPGLASPSYAGAFNSTPGMPAGITYAHETSYYAGGGLAARL